MTGTGRVVSPRPVINQRRSYARCQVIAQWRKSKVQGLKFVDTSNQEATDVAMMRRAISLARDAAKLGEVPVGAVVYIGSEIVAESYNLRETTHDPCGHAELIAIRRAAERLGKWRLAECSLAVTLEPCPMCAGAIVNARLVRVIYGATDPKAGACGTLYSIPTDILLNHRVEVTGEVLAEECAGLLTDFFKMRRSQNRASRVHRRSA